MDMQMLYLLPTLLPGIADDAKAPLRIRIAALLQCQLGGHRHHVPHQRQMLGAQLRKRRNMQLGYQQEMHRCPWMDIMKRIDMLVFMNLLRRDLAKE